MQFFNVNTIVPNQQKFDVLQLLSRYVRKHQRYVYKIFFSLLDTQKIPLMNCVIKFLLCFKIFPIAVEKVCPNVITLLISICVDLICRQGFDH